jgi:peptidyl-prolyl cis-trans isomerase SurA
MNRAWVVAILLMPSLATFAELVDRTVAIVGKEVILRSDVQELLAHPSSAGKTAEEALTFLIDKAVLLEDCKQNGNYPSESEIKQTIIEVQKQNHLDENGLIAALQRSGTTFAAYKVQLSVELCKSRLVHGKIRPRVNISDDDVKRAFEQEHGNKNVKLRLRDMQVRAGRNDATVPKAKHLAEQLAKELQSGQKWESVLANAHKSGMTVVSEELGLLARSDLAPAVAETVFADIPGNFRGPVQTDEGFHVLEVQERVQGQETPLAQVQNDLHKQLFEKEVERLLKQYVDEAKSSVYIDVIGMNER